MGVSDQLQIEVAHGPEQVTLVLVGELDMASAPVLQDALDELDVGGGTTVILDLEQLQFIDSTGLRSILAARNQCRDRGQELALTRGSQQVERLLSVTGVAGHIRTIVAPDEAPAA